MKKKAWARTMVCTAAILLSTQAAWAGVTYSDVDTTTEEGQAIVKLTEAGVTGGYEDGTFRPQGQLTRAEFVKIVNRVFQYKETGVPQTAFDDVDKHWAIGDIVIAQQAGYIGGVGAIAGVGEHCFAPDAVLTREQVAVMLTRILKVEDVFGMQPAITDAVSDWAEQDVKKAVACGLFSLEENNTFRGTEPITRAEVCQVLAGYVKQTITQPQSASEKLQASLQEAVTALSALHYDTVHQQTIVQNLKECIQGSLQDAAKGTEITKEYVEKTYAAKIQETKELYRQLTTQQKEQFKEDLINGMSLHALSVLYDTYWTQA